MIFEKLPRWLQLLYVETERVYGGDMTRFLSRQLIILFVSLIGITFCLCLVWFGARKITSAVMNAVKKGSLRM